MTSFPWQIAKPGETCLFHNDPQCGANLNRSQVKTFLTEYWVYCSCGQALHDLFREYVGVKVRRACAHYLTDPPREWWHGTTRAHWEDTPENAVVHIGTRQAAKERAEIQRVTPAFLYKVRLKDGVSFVRDVEDDCNEWPEDYERHHPWVHRYVNKYESPGSVSAYTRFSNLEIIDRKEL